MWAELPLLKVVQKSETARPCYTWILPFLHTRHSAWLNWEENSELRGSSNNDFFEGNEEWAVNQGNWVLNTNCYSRITMIGRSFSQVVHLGRFWALLILSLERKLGHQMNQNVYKSFSVRYNSLPKSRAAGKGGLEKSNKKPWFFYHSVGILENISRSFVPPELLTCAHDGSVELYRDHSLMPIAATNKAVLTWYPRMDFLIRGVTSVQIPEQLHLESQERPAIAWTEVSIIFSMAFFMVLLLVSWWRYARFRTYIALKPCWSRLHDVSRSHSSAIIPEVSDAAKVRWE